MSYIRSAENLDKQSSVCWIMLSKILMTERIFCLTQVANSLFNKSNKSSHFSVSGSNPCLSLYKEEAISAIRSEIMLAICGDCVSLRVLRRVIFSDCLTSFCSYKNSLILLFPIGRVFFMKRTIDTLIFSGTLGFDMRSRFAWTYS